LLNRALDQGVRGSAGAVEAQGGQSVDRGVDGGDAGLEGVQEVMRPDGLLAEQGHDFGGGHGDEVVTHGWLSLVAHKIRRGDVDAQQAYHTARARESADFGRLGFARQAASGANRRGRKAAAAGGGGPVPCPYRKTAGRLRWRRATPEVCAAFATSRATARTTLRLNTLGMMYSSESSLLETTPAMAWAAASFMGSVILRARASSTPRNRPGKQSTLLIWFG